MAVDIIKYISDMILKAEKISKQLKILEKRKFKLNKIRKKK